MRRRTHGFVIAPVAGLLTALVPLTMACSFEGAPSQRPDAATVDAAPQRACLSDSRYFSDPATGLRLRYEENEQDTFAGASATCTGEGGHMVTLLTEAHRLYVADLEISGSTWIGLEAQSREVWFWVTGERLDATIGQPPFGNGKPDLGPPTQGCARMQPSGLYDDEPCDDARPFLCMCPE